MLSTSVVPLRALTAQPSKQIVRLLFLQSVGFRNDNSHSGNFRQSYSSYDRGNSSRKPTSGKPRGQIHDDREFPVIAERSRRETKDFKRESYESRRAENQPRPKKDPSTITNPNHLKRIEERKKQKTSPVYHSILEADPEDLVEGQTEISQRIVSPENPNLPNHIKKNWEQIPDHLRVCRGCGAGFQCDDQATSGYVPSHHFASYVERTTLQIQAARRDLRVRSGGGKGKGTAVAALHASMQASLIQEEAALEEKIHMGAYSSTKLAEMGLDENMQPLPSSPDYDEYGNPIVYNESANVRAYDIEGARAAKAEHEKSKFVDLDQLSPDAEIGEDGKIIPDKKFSSEITRPIKKEEIIEYRDLKLIENAAKKAARPLRCMRCHQLATSAVPRGAVAAVRSEDFVQLLRNEFLRSGGQSCVIIKMVDLFDFHGSFIRDFKTMAGGRNPIILCVNKIDLLPPGVGLNRVAAWIKRESAKYNIHYHSLSLISAANGDGIEELTKKAYSLARGANSPTAPGNRNIYVVGTTNVGKSTLVNALMKKNFIGTGLPTDIAGMNYRRALKSGFTDGVVDAPMVEHSEATTAQREDKSEQTEEQKDASLRLHVTKIPQTTLEKVIPSEYLVDYHQELLRNSSYITTSPIPGTTLGIVSFPILENKRGGRNLQLRDTPGVLNAHQLSSYLHYDELKAVLPTTQLRPLTYRVKPGQSILIGGFARIDVMAGRPFFLSTFVSRKVTVHITATKNITKQYLQQNLGKTIFPPYDCMERADTLHVYDSLALEPAEIAQMEELQDTSREEFKSSMARVSQVAGRRSGDRFAQDQYEDAITLSLESPKSVKDRTTTLRIEGKKAVDSTLESDKLVPVENAIDTDSPARSFIDSKGRVVYQIQGSGWEQASHDIVLAGLGWVSTTGVGPLTVRVALAGEKLQVPQEELADFAGNVTRLKEEQEKRNTRVENALRNAGVDEYDPEKIDTGLTLEDENATGLHPELQKIYARTQLRNPLLPYDSRSVLKFTGASEAVKLYGPAAGREELSQEQYESRQTKDRQARSERQNASEPVANHANFFEEGDEDIFDEPTREKLTKMQKDEVTKKSSHTPVRSVEEDKDAISDDEQVFDLKELGLDHDLLSEIEVSDDFDSEFSEFSDLDGDSAEESSLSTFEEYKSLPRLLPNQPQSNPTPVKSYSSVASVFDDATFDPLASPVKAEQELPIRLDRKKKVFEDEERMKKETDSAWLDVLRIREARKMTPEEEREAREFAEEAFHREQLEKQYQNNDDDVPAFNEDELEDPFSHDDFDSDFDSEFDSEFKSDFDDSDGAFAGGLDADGNQIQNLSDPGVAKLYELARLAQEDDISDFEGDAVSDMEQYTGVAFKDEHGNPITRQKFSKIMHAEKAKNKNKQPSSNNRPQGDVRAAGSLFTPGQVPKYARRETSYDPSFPDTLHDSNTNAADEPQGYMSFNKFAKSDSFNKFNNNSRDYQNNDRFSRRDDSRAPYKKYDDAGRSNGSYRERDDRSKPFDRSSSYDKPRSSFESNDRDRPRGSFNSYDKPRNSFESDRPRSSFNSYDKPRNSFDSNDRDRPRGSFDSNDRDRPRGSFNSYDKPRNSFESGDRDRPRGSFNSYDKPRNSFDSNNRGSYDKPRDNFGSRSGSYDKPRGSFGNDKPSNSYDKPKSSFTQNDPSSPPRRGFLDDEQDDIISSKPGRRTGGRR